MSTDSVSNFIISIKNAGRAGRDRFTMPYSTQINNLAELLVKHGYLRSVEVNGKDAVKELVVTLALGGGVPKVEDVKRISKPSRRVYISADKIRPVRSGRGVVVLSTTKGVLTGKEAKAAKLGGEVMFEIW